MLKLFLIEENKDEFLKIRIYLEVAESKTIGVSGDIKPRHLQTFYKGILCTILRLEDQLTKGEYVKTPHYEITSGGDRYSITVSNFKGSNFNKIVLSSNGDRVNLLHDEKKEYCLYLKLIDSVLVDAETHKIKTLENAISDNLTEIQQVANITKAQDQKINKITEFIDSAEEATKFLIWVSNFGKPLLKSTFVIMLTVIPLMLTLALGKYLFIDNGIAKIGDSVLGESKSKPK